MSPLPNETPNIELGKDEILDELNLVDDSEKEETIDLDEPKKEEEEEVKVEEELEEEIEPDEDKLELTVPVRRGEILKKYPTLFKDFPYLERAYYREQQYTEIYSTLDDAREASEKAQNLDRFNQELLSGSTEKVLKAVKESDQEAFNKIVDNYLPTLAQVDERAYHHVLGNIIKSTIVAMVRESNSSQNDVLKNAAHILNQFVFGSSEFAPPTNLSKGEDKPDEAVKRREQDFARKQFESTRDDLVTRTTNVLKSTIDANIDPKKSMTDYVRRNATRDAYESLESLIGQDTRFRTMLDKLWEKAFQDDFSKQSIDRIRSTYLTKAKTLLPSVIKQARNEALRGLGKRVQSDEQEVDHKGPIIPGRSTTPSKKISSNPKEVPKEMSTLDYLMSD